MAKGDYNNLTYIKKERQNRIEKTGKQDDSLNLLIGKGLKRSPPHQNENELQ